MKREDIEKAARYAIIKHYNCGMCCDRADCVHCYGCNTAYDCQECVADGFKEGFLKGADWRIDSVWHDASEKPKVKPTLVEYAHIDGSYGYLVAPDATFFGNAISRWVYIEDLIPDMEE